MRKAKKATKKKAAKKKVAKRKPAKRKVAAKKKATKKVRCAAKTKDKKQCKRFTDGKSKYCSVHKKKR